MPVPAARVALEAAFTAADSTEARWLTYRLLWVMPWPATAVPADSDAAAARAIGGNFDQTVLSHHASRPLADTWIAWASKWTQLEHFGACWAELLRASADAQELEDEDRVGSPRSSPSPQSDVAAARGVDSSSPHTDPFLPHLSPAKYSFRLRNLHSSTPAQELKFPRGPRLVAASGWGCRGG